MKTKKKRPARIAKGMGSRIFTQRIRKELTQEQLGDLIGVSHGEIYHLEADKRACTVPRLIALAEALGVTINWIATGEE